MMYYYIYKTTCTITGKFYIGMHTSKKANDDYLGSGKILLNSIAKHGRLAHTKIILEYCSSPLEVRQRERDIVNDILLANPLCMNLKVGGEGGGQRGFRHSNETKAKMSAASKGKPKSLEHAAKCKASMIGRKASDETKAKMSLTRIGMKMPTFTSIHKARLSAARKTRTVKEETKQKTAFALQGNTNAVGMKHSAEFKNHQRELQIGIPKEKVTCPHCNVQGGKPAMSRFHFNKCKALCA